MGINNGLPEDEFIAEKYSKDPFPLWLWLFVVVAVGAVTWGTMSWWNKERNVEISDKPFLKVTNRQFSLFLWQFPQYMRANNRTVTGYLPAYQLDGGIGLDPVAADDWVQVDEEALFVYHTWDRLLKKDYFPRPIPGQLFVKFLNETQIWKPEFWKTAPTSYVSFLKNISGDENLERATMDQLPFEVRLAFQGWRNFFIEGGEIDAVKPTYGEMREFIAANPHYGRNYWRNILIESRPKYLALLEEGSSSQEVPEEELDGFLKAAYYNYAQAQLGK